MWGENIKLRKVKFIQTYISEITMIFKRKHIVVKKIKIPRAKTSEMKIKGLEVYKVKRDEIMKKVIFFDKENNIIGYDNNIGNNKYIWDVVVEPSIIGSEIEYYPREHKWIIKSKTDNRLVDSVYIEYTKSDLNINKNIVGKKFVNPLYTGYVMERRDPFFVIRDRYGYTDQINLMNIS